MGGGWEGGGGGGADCGVVAAAWWGGRRGGRVVGGVLEREEKRFERGGVRLGGVRDGCAANKRYNAGARATDRSFPAFLTSSTGESAALLPRRMNAICRRREENGAAGFCWPATAGGGGAGGSAMWCVTAPRTRYST